MSNSNDQGRILRELQRHVEQGRLGLSDFTAHLPAEELRLLRQAPEEVDVWSEAARARLRGLVELGESRRGSGGAPLRVLLVGFEGQERERVLGLLEACSEVRFRTRSAESEEQARTLLREGGFDAALLDPTRPPATTASRLARAEVLSSGVPVVALVEGDEEPGPAPVGAHDVLWKSELDARTLASALRSAIERHRSDRAIESSQRKEHLSATRDSLTGLPNRFSFLEQLDRALHYAGRHDQQVAVLYLDLDRFDDVNRSLGTDVGDSLIITIAERLQGVLRRSDLVARVGGDEFLLMLQGRELDYSPARTAERLLESLARAFVVHGEEHALSASIGIATYPRDGTEAETLIRNADAALHQVKSEGAGGYRFYGRSHNAVDSRRHLVAERLRRAVANGDLRAHYQPRVDARTGRILGAEALLRWNDGELGTVSPAEFVPIAERAGLMCEIGSWVMHEACRALGRWTAAVGGNLRMSVNVSAHQLHSGSLRDAVIGAMMDASLVPGRLDIELTESALVDNQQSAARLLRELAEIGVSLLLDDFGTGFSALSYLRTFPVRTLKIDPSFVREITPGADFPVFVEAVLSLARTLDLGVIAEGVETPHQREALLERGCGEMQGFLFGRPIPEEDFLGLLRTGRPLPVE